MKKLRWYFKSGTRHDEYSVLYENGNWILVKCDSTGEYSFGMRRDFGSLYGFQVNQSCLTAEETIRQLRALIEIDQKYALDLGNFALENIARWNGMLAAVEADANGKNGG